MKVKQHCTPINLNYMDKKKKRSAFVFLRRKSFRFETTLIHCLYRIEHKDPKTLSLFIEVSGVSTAHTPQPYECHPHQLRLSSTSSL